MRHPKKIADIVADYYEKHFEAPEIDRNNIAHLRSINVYQEVAKLPDLPIDQIKYEEVMKEWKKFRPKKSTDSGNISAFLLKKLPPQYISLGMVIFNRCAANGAYFKTSKHAKVICLSNDEAFPSVNKPLYARYRCYLI